MKITIDLVSPLSIGIVTGIILMAIAGAWNFAKILFAKQIIEKKFFDLFSEVESLHKKYKEEITESKKKHVDELTRAIEYVADTYSKKMDDLLKHNQPPSKTPNYAITPNVAAEYMKNKKKAS